MRPPGTCERKSGLNGTCTGPGSCLPSLRCSTLLTTGTCLRKAPLREPCINYDDCEDGLYCDAKSQRCEALPDAGGDCTFERTGYRCAPGNTCAFSGTSDDRCVAWKAAGRRVRVCWRVPVERLRVRHLAGRWIRWHMHRELLAEGRRRAVAVDEFVKLPSPFRSATVLVAVLLGACNFAPSIPFLDAGKPDSGVPPVADGGIVHVDGGLNAGEACAVLNESRCAYLARCGLIENNAQTRLECERGLEASWCGPMTWPAHVAKGTLRYDPLRAEACAESFLTQTCGEWATLSDSCQRFLLPRVPLGQDCYDGFAECADGVCRGSSCPRTCQPRALLDEVCTVDGDCRSGLYCKLSPFMPSVGQCAAYGSNGTACESDPECLDGLHCIMQQCRALPAPGLSCVEGLCSEAGFCDGVGDAGVCLPRKTEGTACTAGQCLNTFVCDPVRAVCVRIALSSGDACSLAQKCPATEICLGATDLSAGVCHPAQPEGQPCLAHRDCEAHLACQPADGGNTCQRRAPAGSTCPTTQTCQTGAVCTASVCTELPLPGESCADTRACRWGLCRDLANSDGGAVCGPLLSAAQPCTRPEECSSGQCVNGSCVARCLP